MDLKKLFTEDRAVSPVIGVILMVAITVILAAVIGAFVLGIGGDQESTPQASISLDLDPDADSDGDVAVEIAHNGGQTLELEDVGMSLNGSFSNGLEDLSGINGETLSSGETLEITDEDNVQNNLNEDTTVRIVHRPSGGVLATATA